MLHGACNAMHYQANWRRVRKKNRYEKGRHAEHRWWARLVGGAYCLEQAP